MGVLVRSASLADAREIAELTIQLGYELAESDAADRLSRVLTQQDQQFLVAELGGRAVGWVHVLVVEFIETGAFVIIGGLVVDRAHRREGIGRMLMAEAERWAAARNCPVVRLWSTAARTAAHRFYEALGYRNVKTQYSFVMMLNASGEPDLTRFTPRIDA